jgi:hypothetical protein
MHGEKPRVETTQALANPYREFYFSWPALLLITTVVKSKVAP